MAATADSVEMLEDRDAAALTEPMDIYADDPDAGRDEVAVYTSEWDGERMVSKQYFVNPVVGFCTCDDVHYNKPEGGCKHQRRVEFELFDREIPQWANRAAIDSGLRSDQ